MKLADCLFYLWGDFVMGNETGAWLSDNIHVVIGVIFLVGFFWRYATWVNKQDNSVQNLENNLENINGNLDGKITELKDDVSNRLDKIDTNIDNLLKACLGIKQRPTVSSITTESPLTLSFEGKQRADRLNARVIAEKHMDKVLVPSDAHPLAIQDASIAFAITKLDSLLTAEEREKTQLEAYNQGGNYEDVLIIYAVLIRKLIFEKHGIDVPPFARDESKPNKDGASNIKNTG